MPQRDPTTGRFVAGDSMPASEESPGNAELTGFCEWCEEGDSRALSSITYNEGTINVCDDCLDSEGVVQCTRCLGAVLGDGFIPIKAWTKNNNQAELTTVQRNMCHSCVTQNYGVYKDPVFARFILPPDPAVFPETVQITDTRTGRTYTYPIQKQSTVESFIIRAGSITGQPNVYIYQPNQSQNQEEGEQVEMPKYKRMNRGGECIYLCGRSLSEISSESGACHHCRPLNFCPECTDIGRASCSRCMSVAKSQLERTETTLQTQLVMPDNYHHPIHRNFKTKKLRMKNERPYLYYGIEIEVEIPRTLDRIAFAETICLEAKGLFVAERDGSLAHGVEFISRPLSFKMWTSPEIIEILQRVYALFDKFGVFTVNQSSAGMHVHMSKAFFTKSKTKSVEQQKQDIAWIFEYYDKHIATISGRNLNKYCTSKRMLIRKQTSALMKISGNVSIEIGKDGPVISNGQGDSHHHLLSETPNTLEVRTFKSPENYLTVIAFIEMCRSLAHFARNYPIENHNLAQILSVKQSPHLMEYLKHVDIDTGRTKPIESTIKIKGERNYEF